MTKLINIRRVTNVGAMIIFIYYVLKYHIKTYLK
jgi:hypothetical protein